MGASPPRAALYCSSGTWAGEEEFGPEQLWYLFRKHFGCLHCTQVLLGPCFCIQQGHTRPASLPLQLCGWKQDLSAAQPRVDALAGNAQDLGCGPRPLPREEQTSKKAGMRDVAIRAISDRPASTSHCGSSPRTAWRGVTSAYQHECRTEDLVPMWQRGLPCH